MIIDEHKRTLKRLMHEAQEAERLALSAGRTRAAGALAEYSDTLHTALTEAATVETELA